MKPSSSGPGRDFPAVAYATSLRPAATAMASLAGATATVPEAEHTARAALTEYINARALHVMYALTASKILSAQCWRRCAQRVRRVCADTHRVGESLSINVHK